MQFNYSGYIEVVIFAVNLIPDIM